MWSSVFLFQGKLHVKVELQWATQEEQSQPARAFQVVSFGLLGIIPTELFLSSVRVLVHMYNSKRIRRVRNQSVGKRLLEGQIHCDRTGGPGTYTYMTPRCLTSSGVVVLRLVHKPLANR